MSGPVIGVRDALIEVMQSDPGRACTVDYLWAQVADRYTREQVGQSMLDGVRRHQFTRVARGTYQLAPHLMVAEVEHRKAPSRAMAPTISRGRYRLRKTRVCAMQEDGRAVDVGYVQAATRCGVLGFDYGVGDGGLSGGWWPDLGGAERALLRVLGYDIKSPGLDLD